MSLEQSKAEEIREWFRKDPSRMTMVGARHFEVAEADVLTALVGEWPLTELQSDAFPAIMEMLQKAGAVRIFVRSRAAVMECDGNLGEAQFSRSGPFFNVDGGGFDMHIMPKEITQAFAVEKKSHMNGEDHTYSIQFYDRNGDSALKIFLWQDFPKIPAESVSVFRQIVEEYALNTAIPAHAASEF